MTDQNPALLAAERRAHVLAALEREVERIESELGPYDPGLIEVVSDMGRVYMDAEQYEEAAAAYTRSLQLVRPGGRVGIAAWTPEGGIGARGGGAVVRGIEARGGGAAVPDADGRRAAGHRSRGARGFPTDRSDRARGRTPRANAHAPAASCG